MSEWTLTLTKHLKAAPEVVFDAWTTPAHMSGWLSPMTTCSVPELDLKVGGKYRIDMHGDGEDYVHTGEYLEIERPNRLVFTWFSDGTGQQETQVTLEMTPEGDGTLLTLTHERFPSEESKGNHEKGWLAIMEKLEGVFSGTAAG